MSRKVSIGLVQINNSFSGQSYLPYAVACLQAYVLENAAQPERYGFRLPLYKRIPIRAAVDHLDGVGVAGFSTYVWNINISLEIARRLKERCPDTLIVFGGPQVPDRAEEFLRAHPFVDIAVHGEGEQTFLKILESLGGEGWRGLAGISYIDEQGRFAPPMPAQRMRDLDDLPSPFLNGLFDDLMAANPDESWIGLWETNRGCPFRCTYCDWGSATAAKVTKFGEDRLFHELDWFSDKKVEYIFVCDANFGMLKRDVDLAEHVAANKQRTGYPEGFSVQNTKNATERAYLTQKILADAGLNKGVALSMQTIDPAVLENIERDNISLDTYLELQRRFARDGVETYSDLILALPGETYEGFRKGIDLLMETGQHNRIQFNNLSILPNAQMADPAYIERFGLETVETDIINIHGSKEEQDDDVAETQQLVVATAAMPREDWRKTRAYCWMTALLHYDKILQIPIIAIRALTDVRYSDIIDAFMECDAAKTPLLAEMRDFFIDEARKIQEGGPEYVYSKEWLGIYWPADEYIFIKFTAEKRLDRFYEEATALLKELVAAAGGKMPAEAIDDAARLNHALVKQPNLKGNIEITSRYDIMGLYYSVLKGEPYSLRETDTPILIDREAAYYEDFQRWCREVVWWGNKKGAYLYSNHTVEKQLAGHF
jgi:radical SAM superfamily enzyme YgiQ (UPF0313 family)